MASGGLRCLSGLFGITLSDFLYCHAGPTIIDALDNDFFSPTPAVPGSPGRC